MCCANDPRGAEITAERALHGEHTHGLAEEFAGLLEAHPKIELFGSVRRGVPEHGDLVVAAAARFLPDLLDGEPSDTAALRLVGDVEPPDAPAELGDLVVGVPIRHHEPDHVVSIHDDARPRRGSHIRLSDGEDDGRDVSLVAHRRWDCDGRWKVVGVKLDESKTRHVEMLAIGWDTARDAPVRIIRSMVFANAGSLGAVPGKRDALVAHLTRRSSALTEIGCLAYEVGINNDDPDTVFVIELWESAEAHRRSLALPEVQASIVEARPLLSGTFGGFQFDVVGSPLRD